METLLYTKDAVNRLLYIPDVIVNLYCQLVWIEVTKEHASGCHYDGVFREL